MNILYQFDENYAPFAGVSITSLLENNKESETIKIYILGDCLSELTVNKLSELVKKYNREIFFPKTDSILNEFKTMGLLPYRGTYSVYLRLFFSSIINIHEGRLIYVDADTIIDKSLEYLEEYELDGHSVGMVIESMRDKYKLFIGMTQNSLYFNSGVILYDVKKWIENDYCNKIVNHINNVRNNYLSDQDFINIVCENDICILPPEYNFQPIHKRYTNKMYFKEYGTDNYYNDEILINAQSEPVIYHCYRWVGDFPWHKGNLHPFNYKFDEYLKISPWNDYNKAQNTKTMIIRVEKFLYIILPKAIFIKLFHVLHEKMLKNAEEKAKSQITNPNV